MVEDETDMMRYPEHFVAPMRAELSDHGVVEAKTPEDVDALLAEDGGTVMMVVNSVCGCAAGKARPGIVASLKSAQKPDKVGTVFAGADVEATQHLRASHLADFPPSSPSVAIFQNGKPVYVMHRHDIETRGPEQITDLLEQAYAEVRGASAAV